MNFVPRSPRRSTRLRAVVDIGARRAVGRVRDVSTSGAFVEADAALAVGDKVAVLSLAGDGADERRPAEVARVDRGGVGLRYLDEPVAGDAPVFILTDDDDDGDDDVGRTAGGPRALRERNAALLEENGALKRQVMALQARLSMRWTTEEALVKRIATLEELLRRGMMEGW